MAKIKIIGSPRQALWRGILAILVTLTCPVLSTGNEQNKRAITPEDIVNIREVSGPQISPSGIWVAFVVTEPADPNKPELSNSDIWIVPSDGSRPPRKYAFGPKQELMPRWSPDGSYLAFLSNRGEDEKNQVYLMYTDGGEGEAITKAKEGVSTFKWLSDSKYIAYTSKDSLTSEEEKKKEAKNDARVLDENFKYKRLYELNLASREVALITKENESINDFDYSPDNKQVVLDVSATPKLNDVYLHSRLVVINRDGSGTKVLSGKNRGNIRWSPDGKQILYFVPVGKGIACLPGLISPDGGETKLLMEDYCGTIWQMDWLPNSQSILVSSQEGVQGIIGELDLISGKTKRLKKVGHPFLDSKYWNFNADSNLIAYIDASSNLPEDIWIMKSNGSGVKRLTNMNPQVESLAFGLEETVQWKSKDGMLVEGILVKPADYERGKRYPLIVQVHGGPEWSWWLGWQASWHQWAQPLASNGYAVLLPNPRGSDGYGWQFVEANHNDWGGGDFEDIMGGVDYLIEEGIADPERLGIGGWSYGGFMTSWVVSQTGRFKAAVMGAGISNLTSFYGTVDIPGFMKLYFDGHPFDRKQVYEQHSPLTFIKNVQTPTLILHGEDDLRVPVSQGYEFYQGLREMGIETKFVVYPREAHGYEECAHQVDLLKRILEWYDKHLKNQ